MDEFKKEFLCIYRTNYNFISPATFIQSKLNTAVAWYSPLAMNMYTLMCRTHSSQWWCKWMQISCSLLLMSNLQEFLCSQLARLQHTHSYLIALCNGNTEIFIISFFLNHSTPPLFGQEWAITSPHSWRQKNALFAENISSTNELIVYYSHVWCTSEWFLHHHHHHWSITTTITPSPPPPLKHHHHHHH